MLKEFLKSRLVPLHHFQPMTFVLVVCVEKVKVVVPPCHDRPVIRINRACWCLLGLPGSLHPRGSHCVMTPTSSKTSDRTHSTDRDSRVTTRSLTRLILVHLRTTSDELGSTFSECCGAN
jgi:hypothetical protein